MTPVHATRADLDDVATVLARAFADDPVQRWLFAEAGDYDAALTAFMAFFAARYFAGGHLYVAPGPAGATLWSPPDRRALHEADGFALYELVAGLIGDELAAARLAELGQVLDHLPAEPHVYLGVAGVDPSAQGTGLGAALLEPGLRMADDGGFAVHLESSNPRNLTFYHRHGFTEIGAFRLGGDDGPLMTPMRREPQ